MTIPKSSVPVLCFLTRSSVRILLLTDGDDDLLTFVVPGWVVDSAEDITEESLSLFTVLDPKLDVLIIGYGSQNTTTSRNPVDARVIMKMRQKGINVEVLTTENAISTYNYFTPFLLPLSFLLLPISIIYQNQSVSII